MDLEVYNYSFTKWNWTLISKIIINHIVVVTVS